MRLLLIPLLLTSALPSGQSHAQVSDGAPSTLRSLAFKRQLGILNDQPLELPSGLKEKLKSPMVVLSRFQGTEIIVDPTDAPGIPPLPSSGSPPSEPIGACNETRPAWSKANSYAGPFYRNHRDVAHAVAAIIQYSPRAKGWALIGSATLIDRDLMVTAKHVTDQAFGFYMSGTRLQPSTAEAYAVFDAVVGKFTGGIPSSYQPQADPAAIRLPVGTPVLSAEKTALDLSVFRIAPQSRPFVSTSMQDPAPQTELAIIGVPGMPTSDEASNPRWKVVYEICGDKSPTWTVALRIATGSFVAIDSEPGWIRYQVNTIGGISGGAVVDARSGVLVGINRGAEIVDQPYNLGVRGKLIPDLAARFRELARS